ncbi:hypothetical protein [Methylobacterium fujisawaense]|uniref:hypothetical protein n=1 Tax=Methylobacterium fujisawaense TaxID=107400 RepID=UPI002F35534E
MTRGDHDILSRRLYDRLYGEGTAMVGEKYSSLSKSINNRDVADAVKQAAAGKFRGLVVEWHSNVESALVLRMRGKRVGWYLRYKTRTVKLDVPIQTDVGVMHIGAQVARLMIGEGGDPRLAARRFEEHVRENTDHPDHDLLVAMGAVEALPSSGGPKTLAWTWGEAVEAFLKYKLKKLKEPWLSQYRNTMRLPAFSAIEHMRLDEIDIGILDGVRDEIADDCGISTVYRAVQQGKAMLDWVWKYKAGASGLTCQYDWWRRWSVEYSSGKRRRRPTIAQIARTLVLAERYGFPGADAGDNGPGTLGALWAVALTAQRAGQAVEMRTARLLTIDPDELEDQLGGRPELGYRFEDDFPTNWRVYTWHSDEMKAKSGEGLPHSLPLPPEAVEVLLRFRETGKRPGKPYMFPSAKGPGHVTKSGLNILLYRLEGRRQQPKRPSKAVSPRPRKTQAQPPVNYLERHAIPYWSPHDVRRTLTTFLRSRRLGGAASAILGHRTGRDSEEAERERMLAVTEVHYDQSQNLTLKAEGMRLWVDAVLEAYKKEREKFDRASSVSGHVGAELPSTVGAVENVDVYQAGSAANAG